MNLEDIKNMKVPAAMIKKIFPPKKCVNTVDTTGDGKVDSVKLVALNVIMPIQVPSQESLGDFNIDEIDPSEYGKLLLNGEEIDISKNSPNIRLIMDSLRVYHKGESFSFNDALGGKMGGRMIAMGDELVVVFKLSEDFLEKLTEGKHTLSIESTKLPNIEIGFELTKNNMNQKFTS
jgi:ribosomal protein S24E